MADTLLSCEQQSCRYKNRR